MLTPQAALLRRAIVSADETCDEVTGVFYQGGKVGTGTFWNAGCRDGHTFTIQQSADGRVNVLPCATLKAVSKIDCFVPFDRRK